MSSGRVGTVNWLLAALMRLEVEGLGDADVRLSPDEPYAVMSAIFAEQIDAGGQGGTQVVFR